MISLLLSLTTPGSLAQSTPATVPGSDAGSAGAAEVTPDDFSDVVVVWPDKFARWKDTRWLLATEVVIPTGLVFQARRNLNVQTFAFQVRAIISCDQDYKLGRRKIEVACKIEEMALQAATPRRTRTDKDKERVQAVLDEIDDSLTGSVIQLQVNDRGAVNNIDIEGIDTRNDRERQRLETLRQVAARMIYPFHLKLPKSGVKEGNWPEFDSELMSMPSIDGVRGFSTIVHWLNFYKGYLLVQDVGEGTVQVTVIPYTDPSAGEDNPLATDASSTSAGGAPGGGLGGATPAGSGGGDAPTEINSALLRGGPREFGYKLNMVGVSIFNVDNGIMEERVWNMEGIPNAANPTLLKYWYSGRLQLLGEQDKPDLGPTRQISYPGMPVEGLPPWRAVDPELRNNIDATMKGAGGRK